MSQTGGTPRSTWYAQCNLMRLCVPCSQLCCECSVPGCKACRRQRECSLAKDGRTGAKLLKRADCMLHQHPPIPAYLQGVFASAICTMLQSEPIGTHIGLHCKALLGMCLHLDSQSHKGRAGMTERGQAETQTADEAKRGACMCRPSMTRGGPARRSSTYPMRSPWGAC